MKHSRPTDLDPLSTGHFSIFNSETVSEWIYFAVLANHDIASLIEMLELTLAATFLDAPLISEAEIDEAINMDLSLAKEMYGSGNLSKQDYDNAHLSIDRALIKQQLIEAGAGEQLEEGLAACEFLAALLAEPSIEFKEAMTFYGDGFYLNFTSLAQKYDAILLKQLIPKALDIVEKLLPIETAEKLGLADEKNLTDWTNTINKLAVSLKKIMATD